MGDQMCIDSTQQKTENEKTHCGTPNKESRPPRAQRLQEWAASDVIQKAIQKAVQKMQQQLLYNEVQVGAQKGIPMCIGRQIQKTPNEKNCCDATKNTYPT